MSGDEQQQQQQHTTTTTSSPASLPRHRCKHVKVTFGGPESVGKSLILDRIARECSVANISQISYRQVEEQSDNTMAAAFFMLYKRNENSIYKGTNICAMLSSIVERFAVSSPFKPETALACHRECRRALLARSHDTTPMVILIDLTTGYRHRFHETRRRQRCYNGELSSMPPTPPLPPNNERKPQRFVKCHNSICCCGSKDYQQERDEDDIDEYYDNRAMLDEDDKHLYLQTAAYLAVLAEAQLFPTLRIVLITDYTRPRFDRTAVWLNSALRHRSDNDADTVRNNTTETMRRMFECLINGSAVDATSLLSMTNATENILISTGATTRRSNGVIALPPLPDHSSSATRLRRLFRLPIACALPRSFVYITRRLDSNELADILLDLHVICEFSFNESDTEEEFAELASYMQEKNQIEEHKEKEEEEENAAAAAGVASAETVVTCCGMIQKSINALVSLNDKDTASCLKNNKHHHPEEVAEIMVKDDDENDAAAAAVSKTSVATATTVTERRRVFRQQRRNFRHKSDQITSSNTSSSSSSSSASSNEDEHDDLVPVSIFSHFRRNRHQQQQHQHHRRRRRHPLLNRTPDLCNS